MRKSLLLASSITALVVGGLAVAAKHASSLPLPGTYPATATSELMLRTLPHHLADIAFIVPAGAEVRVDKANAPGWVYAYYRQPDGTVAEGYSRVENLAGLGDLIPTQA